MHLYAHLDNHATEHVKTRGSARLIIGEEKVDLQNKMVSVVKRNQEYSGGPKIAKEPMSLGSPYVARMSTFLLIVQVSPGRAEPYGKPPPGSIILALAREKLPNRTMNGCVLLRSHRVMHTFFGVSDIQSLKTAPLQKHHHKLTRAEEYFFAQIASHLRSGDQHRAACSH